MAQDDKSNLPPIEDLGHPDFIQSIVSMAMAGKSPDPTKVEQLGLMLQDLARNYRRIIEDEERGTSVSDQLDCIARIRDAAVKLDIELTKADDDSMVEISRASDEIKRQREAMLSRLPRRRHAGDRHRRERPQINTNLTHGIFRIEELRVGVSELATAAAFAVGMIAKTRGAKGGPGVAARKADVRFGAAREIGDIFLSLTGKRPTRTVRAEKRKDVKGGKHSVAAGPWHGFLAAIMEKIFGDTKGLHGYSQKVVHDMTKTPPNTG